MRLVAKLMILWAMALANPFLHAGETEGLSDQMREGANYLVGNWMGKGTVGDKPATMRLNVRWA